MKKPKTYYEELPSGVAFSCRSYEGNTPLQFQKQWDNISPDDVISVCVRSDKPAKGIDTPMGIIETMLPVFIEYVDMTASQYVECCEKLYTERMTLTDVINEFKKS